jgi:hypothetical protein
VNQLLLKADHLLRGTRFPAPRLVLRRRDLLAILLVFGFTYGLAMGSFGGLADTRWLQMLYSAAKVPLLLLATFALSLPSFFVLNTILGTRADFAAVLRALIASQAGLTVVLASFAPVTLFWYACSGSYDDAILFNALMFGLASLAAQWMLRRLYRPLIAANPRHLALLRSWLLIYAFVGIQMGWILRPFIGTPAAQPQFFRAEMWGNAYVVVAKKAAGLFKAEKQIPTRDDWSPRGAG